MHLNHKFTTLLRRQARKVPHIAVITQPEQDFSQIFAIRIVLDEALGHVKFFAHAHHFLRVVHRRRLVVLAVMQDGLFGHNNLLCGYPHLELKAQVLEACARRFKETHALFNQHFATIQRRPNGRNAIEYLENIARIKGVRHRGFAHTYKLVAFLGRAPVEPVVRLGHINRNISTCVLHQAVQQLQRIRLEEIVGLQNADVLATCGVDGQVH